MRVLESLNVISSVGLALVEEDTQIVEDVNDKFCEIFHYTPGQSRVTIWEIFRTTFKLSNESTKKESFWFRTKGEESGKRTTKYVRVSHKKVEASRGLAILFEVEDITGEKTNENRVNDILENSFDGFWDWHIKDNYEYMSPQFWEMFGYDPSEKKHSPTEWQGMINQDDLKLVLKNFDAHVKTRGKALYVQEARYTHKDGSIVTVLCKGKVIEWDDDGSPLRMVGTHTDVTELKRREVTAQRLRDQVELQKTKLSNLISLANAPLFGVDGEGKVNVWNEYMEKMTGVKKQEILGKLFPTSTGCVTNPTEVSKWIRNGLNGESESGLEALFCNVALVEACRDEESPDVNVRRVVVTYSPQRNVEGCIVGVFFIGQDMSKFWEIKRQLIREQEKASAESALNDFTAHEVRNPLTVAVSAARFLQNSLVLASWKDNTVKEATRNDLKLIHSSLEYINELLDNMLDLNRFIHGSVKLKPSKASILHDVLEPVLVMLNRHTSKVNVEVKCDAPFWAFVDGLRLKQVIMNLAKNALKFVTFGYIHLRAYRRKDKPEIIVLSVDDSGPGIAEFQKATLFQKYQESLDRLRQGTGIGLSLCKVIVESMDGKIYHDSDYRSTLYERGDLSSPGSRFVVELPLPEQAAPDTSPECAWSPGSMSERDTRALQLCQKMYKGTNILVIDDDAIVRKIIVRKFVSLLEVTVFEAANAEIAMEMITPDVNKFSVILVDHYMPSKVMDSMKGSEAILLMRNMGVTSCIIGFSANDVSAEHLGAGASCFLRKPLPNNKEFVQSLIDYGPVPTFKVLIVEDDNLNRIMLKRLLRRIQEDCDIVEATSIEGALATLACSDTGRQEFDAILIDEHFGEAMRGSEGAPKVRELCPDTVLIHVSAEDLSEITTDHVFDVVWRKPLPSMLRMKAELLLSLDAKGRLQF